MIKTEDSKRSDDWVVSVVGNFVEKRIFRYYSGLTWKWKFGQIWHFQFGQLPICYFPCQISHHRQTGFPPSQGKDLSNNGCSKKVRSANWTVTVTKSSATDTKRWLNFVFTNYSLQNKNIISLFSTIPRAKLFWILIAIRIQNSSAVQSRALSWGKRCTCCDRVLSQAVTPGIV